jgi:hypothetical protein
VSFQAKSKVSLQRLALGTMNMSQCRRDLVPSDRHDVHEYDSTPLVQDLPTPVTGTPSPCKDNGMNVLDQFPTALIG